MVVLPLELLDFLLVHVRTHKPTLFSCTLVSRRWLARTQVYLFSSLKINGRNPEQTFTSFAIFLGDSPHISGNVLDLELFGDFPLQPPVLPQETITKIVGALPRLRKLTLSQVALQPFHRTLPTTPSRPLQSLTITGTPVDIYGDPTTGHDFSGYFAVVGLFAQVEQLHIGDLMTFMVQHVEDRSSHQNLKIDSAIETFSIGHRAFTTAIITSFRRFTLRRELKSIEVACFNQDDLKEVGELLRECSEHVRHAGLHIGDSSPFIVLRIPTEAWNSFYDPSSDFLSSFTLDVQVHSPMTMESTVSLLQSLEQCPHISAVLRHLKLELLLPDDTADALSYLSLIKLESLTQSVLQHKSITKLEITVRNWVDECTGPCTTEIASVQRELSLLYERGILDVHD